MEADEDVLTESGIESEDLLMSDEDVAENKEPKIVAALNIDYNSRLTSDISHLNPSGGSDLNFYENENNTVFFCANNDSYVDATCEELEFSDEDFPPPKSLRQINLDDVSCFGVNKSLNSDSTFHQSSTVFKEECQTDAEYLSEDESDLKAFVSSVNCRRRLSGGLSLVDSTYATKDQHIQGSVRIEKSFSSSIFLKNISLATAVEEQSPLMTCLEFLKSENSDEELTDIEEYSMISDDGKETSEVPVHNLSEMSLNSSKYRDGNTFGNALGHREMQHWGSSENVQRKSSLIVELLSEDETTNLENDWNTLHKRNIKKLSNAEEFANDCLTDEESFDLDNKEWTETDESGCVRQVTVVKTETSINFEDAVKSLKKVPEKHGSDSDRKGSTDSEQDDLSFTEKKSYFQRLSLTADTLPSTDKWTHDVSLDDLPMAEGEVVQEQISFEDKLKMFEPDEGNRKKIQKREKDEQPTVYHYDFTKCSKVKPVATEYVVSELEKAEEIVKQVSEEISVEEHRLNNPMFGVGDKAEPDLNSAITLEKVEQEVYSLLAEVDKEERELSKRSDITDDGTSSLGVGKIKGDESTEFDMEDKETAIDLEHFKMGAALSTERIVAEDTSNEPDVEVEGEGEALDSDDLVSSTTTTTTTRVVTSVISDPDVQSEVESSFVQQLSGDDIRQSCEITFSDTVHDTSRPDE